MFVFFHTKPYYTYAKVSKSSSYILVKDRLKAFCKHTALPFRNFVYVYFALMHKSYVNTAYFNVKDTVISLELYNNERLEFLGDSLLSILITEYIYTCYPNATEAFLSKLRSYVVSQPSLTRVGENLHLREYIFSMYNLQVETNKYSRIVANTVEALIGALYLDRGLQCIKKNFLPLFIPLIQKVVNGEHLKDYKSILQIYTQKNYNSVPTYICIDTKENAEICYFKMHLQFDYKGEKYISRSYWDTNKKRAEQKVAQQVCAELNINIENEFI